ncbi:MAG: hypothetical protein JO307_16645 [Bryobacterales bacterium]|nr:hypothetical protein [Bryobacterales bacterium]
MPSSRPAARDRFTASGNFQIEEPGTVIHEPSSFMLSLTGLAAGVLIYRRRRENVQTGPGGTVI